MERKLTRDDPQLRPCSPWWQEKISVYSQKFSPGHRCVFTTSRIISNDFLNKWKEGKKIMKQFFIRFY